MRQSLTKFLALVLSLFCAVAANAQFDYDNNTITIGPSADATPNFINVSGCADMILRNGPVYFRIDLKGNSPFLSGSNEFVGIADTGYGTMFMNFTCGAVYLPYEVISPLSATSDGSRRGALTRIAPLRLIASMQPATATDDGGDDAAMTRLDLDITTLKESCPELVHTDDDGSESINSAAVTVTLIEAVMELENRISEQKELLRKYTELKEICTRTM